MDGPSRLVAELSYGKDKYIHQVRYIFYTESARDYGLIGRYTADQSVVLFLQEKQDEKQ
jgi:hypothetical protein